MEDIFKIVDSITPLKEIVSIKVFGPETQQKPFFTIAIPTYKRASLLKEALDSALFQEKFDDYNVIICDNNPERNDETEILMMSYKNNPKVSYYKHSQNVGMAGNWNKCVFLSKSDNLVLLHDDDFLSPNALLIFRKCILKLSSKWSLIKPNLIKFKKVSDLNFPKNIINFRLTKLTPIHFFESCPVGAPSCILLNRKKYIEIGGVNMSKYPCIDYEMSLKLSHYGYSYILSGGALGGYRVAQNESLTEKTMDNYFVQRYHISRDLMCYYNIPSFIINILQQYFEVSMFVTVKKYYNMPKYHKKNKITISVNTPRLVNKVIIKSYFCLLGLFNHINKKKIHI